MKFILSLLVYLLLTVGLNGQAFIPNEYLDTIYYSKGQGFISELGNSVSPEHQSFEIIGYRIEQPYNNKVHLVKVYYMNSNKPLAEFEATDTLTKNPTYDVLITENALIPEYTSSKHKEGAYKEWYESGKKKLVCNYKNNKLHGEFLKYHTNGQLRRQDTWKWGLWSKGNCYDQNGNEMEYVPYIVLPEFIGGEKALYSFIQKNTYYPNKAYRKNIQGKVFVKFAVDHDGSVIRPEIIKGVHEVLDQEALRVMKMMPNWKPGVLDGETVRTYYTLPFNFAFQ